MAFACRDMNCGMSFSSVNPRNKHESIMHKNMYKDAAKKLIQKINSNHTEEALNKKIIKTSTENFSYKDALRFIDENNEEKLSEILLEIEKLIKLYLERNQDAKIYDLLTFADIRIS
jgi:hypothetical protein